MSKNKVNNNIKLKSGGGIINDGDGLSANIKFGGTGADGALVIASGTTTLDLGGVSLFVKNYTNINIANGATLNFSNPNDNGTIIIFKSRGNVILSGTINIAGIGSLAGAAGTNGKVPYANLFSNTEALAGQGTPTGWGIEVSSTSNVPGITTQQKNLSAKIISLTVGGGGGGGKSTAGGAGGAGGRGAGCLYIECAGDLTSTGIVNINGENGSAGAAGTNGSGAGGGGGGAGGSFIALYNGSVINSGTYNINGGNGGNGGDANGQGGGIGAAGGHGGGNAYAGGAGGRIWTDNYRNGNAGGIGNNSGGTGGTGGTSYVASGGSGGGGGAGGYYLIAFNTDIS